MKSYLMLRTIFFRIFNFFQRIRTRHIKKIKPSALILAYHRVIDIDYDPTELCVNLKNFESQIYWLSQNKKIIPLEEMAKRVANKTLTGDEVSITFDDGYADVITNAVPILQRYAAPFTLFITTQNLFGGANYIWDINYPEHKYLHVTDLHNVVNLCEIGAHTISHLKLSRINKINKVIQIIDSKKILENYTNTKINSFAYPFGGRLDIDSESINIVKANFKYACSTFPEAVTHKSKIHCLPRVTVKNFDAKEFVNLLCKFQ